MSELINKLEGRSLALCALGKSNDSELMEEAADTIEQLTKERDELVEAYGKAIQALFYSGIYDGINALEFRQKLGIPDWFKQDLGVDQNKGEQ